MHAAPWAMFLLVLVNRPQCMGANTSKFMSDGFANWLSSSNHNADKSIELAIASIGRKVLALGLFGVGR